MQLNTKISQFCIQSSNRQDRRPRRPEKRAASLNGMSTCSAPHSGKTHLGSLPQQRVALSQIVVGHLRKYRFLSFNISISWVSLYFYGWTKIFCSHSKANYFKHDTTQLTQVLPQLRKSTGKKKKNLTLEFIGFMKLRQSHLWHLVVVSKFMCSTQKSMNLTKKGFISFFCHFLMKEGVYSSRRGLQIKQRDS